MEAGVAHRSATREKLCRYQWTSLWDCGESPRLRLRWRGFANVLSLRRSNHFAEIHTKSAERADARLVTCRSGGLPQFSLSLDRRHHRQLELGAIAPWHDRDGMIAMAEQVMGGSEPDGIEFVTPVETERYASKANRVVARHSLGKVVAVVELVSPGNKDSRHALRSFVEKTVGLLYDNINLLIIDPIPPSPRDPQGIHKAIWDEITDEPFALPSDRKLTLAAYQASPIKTAYFEPFAVGSLMPDMPLFLQNDFYINVPLEATYMDTWNVLPPPLRDLVL